MKRVDLRPWVPLFGSARTLAMRSVQRTPALAMIARVATTPRPAPGPGQPADELIGAIDGKPADTTTLLLIGGPGYRGGAGVTQTQGVGVQGDVEGRLRRLEDVIEIQQLFVSYGHCLDRGDFAAYAQLFAEDGEFMMGPVGRAH